MQIKSISEQMFFTTVRIETLATNGEQGCGTGFLFSYKSGDQQYPFVVTNKHVVMGNIQGSLSFIQRQEMSPALGQGFRIDIQDWNERWFGHPSPDIDIAICPFKPLEVHIKQHSGISLFYRYVTSGMIPTQAQVEELDAIESVTFIGYPNGVWDRTNLLPIARRGTTASPIEVDFEGSPRFLIDASVFGGSSGSPVFILNQGAYPTKDGGTVIGSRFFFVGVIAAVFYRTQLNEIVPVPIPTQVKPMSQHQEMIDLGIVFKASTVVETIEAYLKANGISTVLVPPSQPTSS